MLHADIINLMALFSFSETIYKYKTRYLANHKLIAQIVAASFSFLFKKVKDIADSWIKLLEKELFDQFL